MDQRRVVITGIGVISALGDNANQFWDSASNGRSGIGPIKGVDMLDFRFKNGGEVKGFDPLKHFEERFVEWLDPFCQFGIVSAREAIADSGITFTEDLKINTGVITGSCLGGQTTEDDLFHKMYALNKHRGRPGNIPAIMANAVASHVSMEFGLKGASFTTATACSSANHAIGQAFWLVRQGTLDAAVTGGSEAPFSYGHLRSWEGMRVVSPVACRPFSKDRDGMILGEGGAMFVMEALDHAQARGAKIYAEIAGFGMTADAHHLTMPLAEGAARAMKNAIVDGGIAPEQVGYVNAHGTATQANDVMESEALRIVFGDHTDNVAVSSTKSMHGHTLGAAGAIESAATVLALHNNLLPPTANFTELDPECNIDVIANEARPAEVEAAISNSFAFGGLNAVLAFKKWTGK
ncbi:MAG: beta-ketoacyl-[acyl-carrier-protein] synthase family protein [Pyrinomonadaceae bacterium]